MAKAVAKATERQAEIIKQFVLLYGVKLNLTGAAIIEQLIAGPKTVKELKNRLGIVPKTIRYWLEDKLGRDKGIVRRIPNLNDMRSFYYCLEPQFTPKLENKK